MFVGHGSVDVIWLCHQCFSYTELALYIQTTLFIRTLDTTTKFVIMTIWLSRNLRPIAHWGNSNKYPKHMFYEIKNKTRPFLHINLLIMYSVQQKFILMAMSLGTNAVVVTRVHCIRCIAFCIYWFSVCLTGYINCLLSGWNLSSWGLWIWCISFESP